MARSTTLHAATSASTSVQRLGVARVDSVLSRSTCKELKEHILSLKAGVGDPTAQRWAVWMGAADNRYVPGSRIRFSSALEERLTSRRSDLLLPLEDGIVSDAVRTAASALQETLCTAAQCLPLRVDHATADAACTDADADVDADSILSARDLELVECGALIALPGADHQALHADFRRDNVMVTAAAERRSADADAGHPARDSAAERPNMPPRLVTFVYLQDAPSVDHGPTAFLPGTANARAHECVLTPDGRVREGALDDATAEVATVAAGDAVMYDASVLHFGAANLVADNDRVVLYFGIARAGHAAECAGPTPEGWEAVDAVPLWDYC